MRSCSSSWLLCTSTTHGACGGLTSIMRPKRQNGGRDALSTRTACFHPTFKSCGEAYHTQETSSVCGSTDCHPRFPGRHIIIRCLPAGSVTHTVRPPFPHHAFYVVRVPLSLLPLSRLPLSILPAHWYMHVGVHPSRHPSLRLLAKTNRP